MWRPIKITWYIFLVHVHSLVNGSWIKVHENDFNKTHFYSEKFMYWSNPNPNRKAEEAISWARNYDDPWNNIPPILVKFGCSRRFIPFTSKCYQVYNLCCLEDHRRHYNPFFFGFTYAWCVIQCWAVFTVQLKIDNSFQWESPWEFTQWFSLEMKTT